MTRSLEKKKYPVVERVVLLESLSVTRGTGRVPFHITPKVENVLLKLYYSELARLGLWCTTEQQDTVRGLVSRRPDGVEVFVYPKRKMCYRRYLKRLNTFHLRFPNLVDVSHLFPEG